MSDISTGLIEYAEHKRLLFERIRHKFGSFLNESGNQMGLPVDLPDSILSSLYIESAEMLDLQILLNQLEITDDKIKMKWIGLYTVALAKETYARITWGFQLGSGHNVDESKITEYCNLLSESKEEKIMLIKLLDGSNKK